MNLSPQPGLVCRNLRVSVPGRTLVQNLDLDICAGEVLAVLGPNGVGKSLTLLTLAALRSADAGSIRLHDKPIEQLSRSRIATHLALLPQYTDDVFPATVLDTVLIGRHPHIARFQWESARDKEIAQAALAEVDLAEFQQRNVVTLSGGERRRLAVAQVLAQQPQIFLLDEPTNHLDPQHQLDVLKLFASRSSDGAAVVASLHDVNLAARFADRCLLLYGDGRWTVGRTDDVLSGDSLTELYATPMESVSWRGASLYVATG